MPNDFRNKVIAVTGAASGIGAATARLLKSRGAAVVALDRVEPDPSLADEFIKFDQGEYESIAAAVAEAPKSLDGLMNIAGAPPSANLPIATLLTINFYGLRVLTEGLLDRLPQGAPIVNMSSHAGHRWRENHQLASAFLPLRDPGEIQSLIDQNEIVIDGLSDRAAYPLSKQLLNLWTVQSFAAMAEKGLRMNAVSAAGVATPILDDFLTSFGADSAERIKQIGVVSSEELAETIVFLASDQAAPIRSAVIPADNGAFAMASLKYLQSS